MRFEVLNVDKQAIPDLLCDNGVIRLHPSAFYDNIPREYLRAWCHFNGRYSVVTTELISWLKALIGERKAIEIGAGAGDLSYYLGIKATDLRIMERPEVALQYKLMGQPTTPYGSFVKRLEALDAIERFEPEVVIASWVTEWIDPTLPPPPQGGCVYGVKEDLLLKTGVTYVLIGNEAQHGQKQILSEFHETYRFPWLRSRAIDPSKNLIYVWPGR